MLINELLELNEASVARRAWDGKLKRIDALLGWMYDQKILTATDRARKDKVFRQYYRYYNDGDMPAALKNKGLSKWDRKDRVQLALEEYLEEFIKEMLQKYMPKADRKTFRIDKAIADLSVVWSVAERHDAHALLTYWLKKTAIRDDESVLKGLVDKLQAQYDRLKSLADEDDPSKKNTILSVRREQMQEKGDDSWTPMHEKLYANMRETCNKIAEFIDDLIKGLKKLKEEGVETK